LSDEELLLACRVNLQKKKNQPGVWMQYCRKKETQLQKLAKGSQSGGPFWEDPFELTSSGNANNDNQLELDNIDGNANDEEDETLNEITHPSSSSQMPR
jgi:hypothetical protein